MHSNEWPLITFTLIAQFAVGVVVGLTFAFGPLHDRVGYGEAADTVLASLVVVLALLVVAGVVATLHLGNVRNVYLVLSNWRSSWLSREIVAFGVFGAMVLLFAVVTAGSSVGTSTLVATGGLASLFGVVLVAVIAKLYMLRTVPVWNRAATPVAFFLTAVILGFVGVAVAIAVVDESATRSIWRALGLLAVVAAAVQIGAFEVHRRQLGREDGAARRSGAVIDQSSLPRNRAALAAIGIVVSLLSLWGPLPPVLGLAAAGLLLIASEAVGRHLFYASYAREGL